MADVRVRQTGSRWWVYRDGETVGRYDTEDEAREAEKIALYADTWPPESGAERIRWHGGKWEFRANGKTYRDARLIRVIHERDKVLRTALHEQTKKATEAVEKRKAGAGCAKCVWRMACTGGERSKTQYHCGYSLCLGHHSRVWLHYQRTGRESLEGMTHGTGCTEFMAGNPRDKLSLMTDNPANVTEKGWALLAKEGIIVQKAKTPKPRKLYKDMVEMDIDRAKELREGHTWRELAGTAGLSISSTKSCWEKQRINRYVAQRLLDAYGIDITKK